METRVCATCKAEKPLTEFWRTATKKNKGHHSTRCEPCVQLGRDRTSPRECNYCSAMKPVGDFYRHANGTSIMRKCRACFTRLGVLGKYQLSIGQFNSILEQQNGQCGICGCSLGQTRYTQPCVDHYHATGKVRGILCHGCNTALGFFKESPIRLTAALAYLEKHSVNDIVCPARKEQITLQVLDNTI